LSGSETRDNASFSPGFRWRSIRAMTCNVIRLRG